MNTTTNLELLLPDYTDDADVSILNYNSVKLDGIVATKDDINEVKGNIGDLDNAIDGLQAIIATKMTTPAGGSVGLFLTVDENGDPIWGQAASPSTVAAAAEAWLEEHVDPGQTLAIDAQLELQGYAADAQVTGNKLTLIASDIAPLYAAAAENDPESYVMYDREFYFLESGHAPSATWGETTKRKTTVGEEIVSLRDNVIAVGASAPTNHNNRMWVKPQEESEVLVPTYQEFQHMEQKMGKVIDSDATDSDLDLTDPDGNVIVRMKDGHIQTKNFNSKNNAGMMGSSATGVDLDFADQDGNVVMRLQNGHIKTKNFDSTKIGGTICYVSPSGLDTNSGDSTHPFKTIQHAIDGGYSRIMLAPGEYKNQKVNISNRHGISIICNTNQKENNIFESHKRQARAKLDNSIDVTGLTAYNSIYRTSLSVDPDSSYYNVFVTHDVEPVYSGPDYYGRVTTYNEILWEITDDILTCTRLIPKLSLSDCESTAGSFYYDGEYLYVHPTNGSLSGVSYKRLNDDTFTSVTNGFYIYNSTDIYIEGVDVQYFPYYGFHANIVSGLTMRDCGFFFTCYGSACEFHYTNADLWECNAAQAGADGFGIAAGGNTSFYNCNAIYCYDDGISHHDEATGIIDGGRWMYCKKGGVTPSFGSHVTVKNVIATNNVYGIYWTQSGERVTDGVQYMQNCLAVDNTTKDIKVTGYDVVAHGCSYGTKGVDTGATLTEYNCAVIS